MSEELKMSVIKRLFNGEVTVRKVWSVKHKDKFLYHMDTNPYIIATNILSPMLSISTDMRIL